MKNKIIYILILVLGVALIGISTYDISRLVSDDYIETTGLVSYKDNKPVIEYIVDEKAYEARMNNFLVAPKASTKIKIKYNTKNYKKYVVNDGMSILPNIFIGFILLVFAIFSLLNRSIEVKHANAMKISMIVLSIVFAVYENIVLFSNVDMIQLVVFDLIFITLISYLINSLKNKELV